MNKLVDWFVARLSNWLLMSSHFHLRVDGVKTLGDLVDLIDRFNDGNIRYPLEWDDFISWENGNPVVEEFRQRIGVGEPLLFSKNRANRDKYAILILEERNKAAKMAGLPVREMERVLPLARHPRA